MEKEIRKLHGRILFPSVMYIANIPAGMQLWQTGSHESLYTGFRFLSPMSRGPGTWERILQIRKKAWPSNKNTDTIPCSMSPHSRTTGKHWFNRYQISFLDFSSMQGISASPEARNTVWHGFVSVFLCCHLSIREKRLLRNDGYFFIASFLTIKTPDSSHADAR